MTIINLLLSAVLCSAMEGGFVDMTDSIGLGSDVVPETVSRLCIADINNDGWPDAVIDRHRIFLNVPDEESPIGRRFVEVPSEKTGLPKPLSGTVTVFADLDNDGHLDAVVSEYIDKFDDNWVDHGRRTCWHKGRGDGTFGEPRRIINAPEATACAIAVGDVDLNGQLDLWMGNWYARYGVSYVGHPNDLLLQAPAYSHADDLEWILVGLPADVPPVVVAPEEDDPFDDEYDGAGRPTYGVMIADLDGGLTPELIELDYGRRWNRLFLLQGLDIGSPHWRDIAPSIGFDGDDIRHGRHPEWLRERAREDSRFDREDERPYRANGNTFDCSIGDVDNDGDFDVFIAEIAHGWAGESSDRSRMLVNGLAELGHIMFIPDERKNIDRVPPDKNSWNHGDLFCEMADLDHDGRLDLILSSGDYPDNQRLRIYLQNPDGSVRDATEELGVDHEGSQQVSLADVDGDGDLDILVGQTFVRYSAEKIAGRSPHIRLLVNESTQGRQSITLRLRGDGENVNTHALGSIARAKLPDGTQISRQLIGIGGHAGKQRDFIVHLGLGDAAVVGELTVQWPDAMHSTQRFRGVPAGRYTLSYGGELMRVER